MGKLPTKNFRKVERAELTFQAGLNVQVGGSNVAKTAVVDGRAGRSIQRTFNR